MHYFVVLAYNEEQNLPRLFTTLHVAASSLNSPYVLILVNDGSADGTVAVAEEYQKRMPIQIEHHSSNLGVAQGFRTGFRAALTTAKESDIIFTLEADNTGDLALLPLMLEKIHHGADVAMASCYAPGGSISGVSFERRFMSASINKVMRLLFPIARCHTYSSFFRAYRSDILLKSINQYGDKFIQSDGFTVAAEILFKLRRLDARMDEIPMFLQFDERKGKSKMKVGRTIMEYITFLSREIKEELLYRMRKS